MKLMITLLLGVFTSAMLCHSLHAVQNDKKNCKEYIYEAAERNFWDLNGDYFDSYAHKVSAEDKQFFDAAIHCFDKFAALEKKLCDLEIKLHIHEHYTDDLFIATKMNVLENYETISQIRECLKALQNELPVMDASVRSLPTAKEKEEFIRHYDIGRKLYPIRLSSRSEILSLMSKMNALYCSNKSKWHIEKGQVIVADLAFSSKLNECRLEINKRLPNAGAY